jgi:hypothetical protein
VLAGGSSSSCGLTLPESGSVLVYASSAPNNQVPGVPYGIANGFWKCLAFAAKRRML